MNEELELLGFSKEGISNMNLKQYEEFKIFLEKAKEIVVNFTSLIFITTCSFGLNKLIRDFNI